MPARSAANWRFGPRPSDLMQRSNFPCHRQEWALFSNWTDSRIVYCHWGSLNMSRYESRLHELGVSIPDLPKPIANYVPAKRSGNLVFTAGQVSSEKGRDYKGKLGADLSLDDAQRA